MDLVLETLDTFVLDSVYTKLFPAALVQHVPQEWVKMLDLNDGFLVKNSTLLRQTIEATNSLPKINKEVYGYTPFLFNVTEAAYTSLLPRYNLIREFFSLWAITAGFGWGLYFFMASLSYMFVFDRSVFNHPRYLKNQMSMEIKLAASAIPLMSLLTVPWFLMEINGYSRLYYYDPRKNWVNYCVEIASFIFFTDMGIYFAHRWLHWPTVYKHLHKPHHKWLVCTPFASHAFHPVDGYFQSLSYHVYPFLFPLQKLTYLGLFTFVNFWTIMIHDGNHMYNNKIVNGTACHTVHHLYFSYNFGQFTTLWDRLGGSYRRPDDSLFDPKLKKDAKVMEEQLKMVELEMKAAEGDEDDRVYEDQTKKTQ